MLSEVVLCVVLTVFYVLLFVSSLVQLLRIVVAQHDYYSFQFGFLVLAVLWSAARAFFFGEWFGLPELLSLLLWWLPFDLQFSTFSLLILFYASLLHHSRWHHGSHKRMAYATVLAVVNVSAPLLTTAWAVTSVLQSRDIVSLESVHHAYNACQLFALFAVFLYHGYKLHSSPGSSHLLSSLLRPLFPLSLLTTLCLIVFLSRAIFAVLNSVGLYDIEIGGDEGGWKLVSPLAFVVLFLWEVLPTAAVILFFHHIPNHGRRKWQWAGGWCGGCWSTECRASGESSGRRAAAGGGGGGGGAGGDGESERSGSPHSASSRLSYNLVDELDAELLQSGGSLSSHSFSSSSITSPAALQPPLQHTALYSQPVLAHSSSSPAAATAAPSSASPSPSVLSSQPPHLLTAPSSHLLPAPILSVQQQRLRRPHLSSQAAPPLQPTSPAAFSPSFSPPLSLSPSPAAVSLGAAAVLSSPDGRGVVYGRAAERWRVRRDGGAMRAVDGIGGAGGSVIATTSGAGNARTAVTVDDDEYEYSASLDSDV